VRGAGRERQLCRRLGGRDVLAASDKKAAATAGERPAPQTHVPVGSESTGQDQLHRLVRTAGEADMLTTPGVAAFTIGLLAQQPTGQCA